MPSDRIHRRGALALCCLCAMAGGCARRNVQAAAPVAAPPAPALAEMERPMTIAPDTDASPPLENTPVAPTVAAEEPAALPVAVPPLQTVPAPRRPAEPPAESAAEAASRRPAPVISPQLSAGDQASYERETGEDIGVAEKNLQGVQGKQLSAAQQDIVDKIRSFLGQARDASKVGDWARAQNSAHKARLLSIELMSTL